MIWVSLAPTKGMRYKKNALYLMYIFVFGFLRKIQEPNTKSFANLG